MYDYSNYKPEETMIISLPRCFASRLKTRASHTAWDADARGDHLTAELWAEISACLADQIEIHNLRQRLLEKYNISF